ncbi:hypothetical protein HDE_00369 [Halotydeus destructor]|nr:hypothetical protein HDE_00369 [Halotydeus destructor]
MALFNRSMLPRDAVEAEKFAIDRGLIVETRVCNRHSNKTPTSGIVPATTVSCGERKKSVADGSWFENARLEPRKIFEFKMVMLPNNKRDKSTLESVIVQHGAPGSTISTDAWRGYLGHEFVNHSDQHGFNWVSGKCVDTQQIEALWRRPEDACCAKHPNSNDVDFATFLSEFLWRRHCKKLKQDPFLSLLPGVAEYYKPAATF